MNNTLKKFTSNPVGFLRRVVYKTVIAPFVYGRGNDYHASEYWRDRFLRYGTSLQGVANEGLSLAENQLSYQEAAQIFLDICSQEKVDFPTIKVFEIGCGNGFYTEILAQQGVKNYLGIDITDVLFTQLQAKFPEFQFAQKDITEDTIPGEFDLIIMIDVIEHIVNDQKFTQAMNTIKDALKSGGIFLVNPVFLEAKKELFYVRFWQRQELLARFSGYDYSDLIPFRDGNLMILKKP